MRRFARNVFVLWILVMGAWVWGVRWYERSFGIAGECAVSYVYDGDTVALTCGSEERTARLQGFDTPETKEPGCDAEAALGKRATLRLREMVKSASEVSYRRVGHDKYGRELIVLELNGEDAGARLIEEGLAVAYTGGSRIDWCDRLGAGG